MVRHDQTRHHFALDHMTFHDFDHIVFRFDRVPDSLGINDDAGALRAVIETAGFIGAHDVLEVEALGFLFKSGVQVFRAEMGATAARIVRAALVCADKNMSFESGQCSFPKVRLASWWFETDL